MGTDPATEVKIPITAWFAMDADQEGKTITVGQHNQFNGVNKLNGIGRKLWISNEGMATIWEGQFSEDKLHGFGRRYIVSMAEEFYFYDIGFWKSGL